MLKINDLSLNKRMRSLDNFKCLFYEKVKYFYFPHDGLHQNVCVFHCISNNFMGKNINTNFSC